MFEQVIGSFAGYPRDLIDMVDVGMQADLLCHVTTLVRQLNEGIGPRIGVIDYTAWCHSKTFRRKADALDVRDAKQSSED